MGCMSKFFPLFFISTIALGANSSYDELRDKNKSEFGKFVLGLFERAPATPSAAQPRIVPELSKGTSAHKFRTEIRRQSAKNSTNFAGHWSLVVVGCGTGCARYFLVNGEDNSVIDPNLITTNGHPIFRQDQALLVVTDASYKSFEEAKHGAWGPPKAWTWTGARFEPVRLELP